MSVRVDTVATSAVIAVLALGLTNCDRNDIKYKPKPAPSGVKANLPPVPNVPQKPIKKGDAYTVWGASYYLRSRVHHKQVADKTLSITGWIVKTNLPDAPKCAVHKTGKADPQNCNAPVPAFWIGDTRDAKLDDCIKVEGWASNFAQIFDAVNEYKKVKDPDKGPDKPVQDELWGVNLPYPLPVKGVEVTVTGQYSTTFTRSSTGTEADPIMGLLTYQKIDYKTKPTEAATLPGMKKD